MHASGVAAVLLFTGCASVRPPPFPTSVGQESTNTAKLLFGRVVGITDGDTVKVLLAEKQQIKIRLAGIDSPEHDQAYGAKATQSLSDLILGQDVTLDCRKKKSFDREVCVVYFGANDINIEQVSRGMAWWARKYAHEQTALQRGDYECAERDAKVQGRGLWADPNPIPPWEWRHR